MVNFNSKLYCAYLSLLGYRKIPLKDTRGILDNSNNFKYYKESLLHNSSKTIYPTGTKVTFKLGDMDVNSRTETINVTRIIKKNTRDTIKTVRELGKKQIKIYKNNKLFNVIG